MADSVNSMAKTNLQSSAEILQLDNVVKKKEGRRRDP